MKRLFLSAALAVTASTMFLGSAFALDAASNGASLSIAESTSIAADAPANTVTLGDKQCADGKSCRGNKLSLSEDQLKQLQSLRDKFSVDNATKKAQLQTLQHQLRNQLGEATINKSAVLSTQDKINSLRSDLSNARLSMMLEASSIFTPEQRAQMKERKMRHFGGHHGRRGGGHHRHGGGFKGGSAPSAPTTNS